MLSLERFNVRIVNTGDRYGRNDCLINDKPPMVEFYDNRFDFPDFMGRGQFVSRYYVSTLLERQPDTGLCLDGGVPAWSVSAQDMEQVMQYIQQDQTA